MNEATIDYIYNGVRQITILPKDNHFRPWYTEENFLQDLQQAFTSVEQQLEQQIKKPRSTFLQRLLCRRRHDDIKEYKVHDEMKDANVSTASNIQIDIGRTEDFTVVVDIKNNANCLKDKGSLFGKAISAFYTSPAVVKPGPVHHLISSIPPVY